MSKSALVMETPKNCYECPFSCTNGNDTDCGYCELAECLDSDMRLITEEHYDYESESRPDWCPLKPLPEKDTESYFPDEFGDGYATGWNACIDVIAGGNVDD